MNFSQFDRPALHVLADAVGRIDYGGGDMERTRETLRDAIAAARAEKRDPIPAAMFGAPTNADRAGWAQTALDAFMALGGTDECDGIGDLVTNLLHLARRRAEAEGKGFDASSFASRSALMHDMEQSDDEEGDDAAAWPCPYCDASEADGHAADCEMLSATAPADDGAPLVEPMEFFLAVAANDAGVHWSSAIWATDDSRDNVIAGAELEAGVALGNLEVAVTLHGPFTAGPALSTEQDCGQCEGTGRTDAMGHDEQCPVCDGTGTIPA